jgi:hypothetical protein
VDVDIESITSSGNLTLLRMAADASEKHEQLFSEGGGGVRIGGLPLIENVMMILRGGDIVG